MLVVQQNSPTPTKIEASIIKNEPSKCVRNHSPTIFQPCFINLVGFQHFSKGMSIQIRKLIKLKYIPCFPFNGWPIFPYRTDGKPARPGGMGAAYSIIHQGPPGPGSGCPGRHGGPAGKAGMVGQPTSHIYIYIYIYIFCFYVTIDPRGTPNARASSG